LRRLRGSPEDPDLDQLADLDEKDLARLAELRVVVATAQTSTAREDAAAAEREAREAERLASSIESLAALLHEDSARALKNAVAADRDAREAVALAAQQLEGSIPQVGGGPWQLMWNAARGFVEAGGGTFPPVEGGTCPLCLQAVSAEVAERFVHFQRHVTGEVQAVADLRARELQGRLEAISPLSADSVAAQPLIAALREREPALAENFDSVVAEIRQNLSAWQIAPDDAKPAALDTSVVTKALRAWGEMRSEHARTLREADNSETLPSLRRELAELEARTRLKENLPVFNDWQMILGRIGNLDLAHSALATNRLTSAQRGLIEEGLAKALDAALTDELKKLSCTLPIQMRAEIAKAEASVGLRLLADDPPRVSAIASEGERRALALSFFLAELLVADDSGGVILDDPVSSLDDERRTYIADRLVDESKRRQVIVFTHDLPFVFELRSRAKTAGVGVHVQHVWRQGDDVGRVDEDPPFQTMNLKTRVNRLADDLERMRKDRPPTNDEAWRRVNGFYERLRISWERAVEERLFGGVIERFERNVKTQQFRKIKVTPERLDAIEAGMSQCSRFVHESAYAAPVALPSIDEIAKDLEQLRAFERDTRADD
jgi:ABC-type transport system involved in cytochrome c biogenesis ATPase subunit